MEFKKLEDRDKFYILRVAFEAMEKMEQFDGWIESSNLPMGHSPREVIRLILED